MPRFQVRRLGYALGAEISGIDVTRPLDEATVAEIRRAWLEHLVLCFPDQDFTKEGLVAFASRFGEIDKVCNPKTRDHEYPDLLLVTNKPRGDKPWDGHTQGQTWHSDQSCTLYPSPGTFVLAKELPDVGGTTLFANQYMAYETLSPKMRDILDGLEAVHDLGTTAEMEKQRDFAQTSLAAKSAHEMYNDPPVVHPAVKVHPETKRPALYLDDRVAHFVGMTKEETQPLLSFFLEHAVRHEFTYRHVWRENDLILWDNRCLMHRALIDYDQRHQYRHMWRCAMRGDKSGHIYDGSVEAA